jgi:hypothetical protein
MDHRWPPHLGTTSLMLALLSLSSPGLSSAQMPPGAGRCGDGICDMIETRMGFCAEDCGLAHERRRGPRRRKSRRSPTTSGPVGFIGCSLTLGTVQGYEDLGGKGLWSMDNDFSAYPGGSSAAWHSALARDGKRGRWAAFRRLLAANPRTETIWWMLCAGRDADEPDYEDLQEVLAAIKREAPKAAVYVTPPPERSGSDCALESPESTRTLTALADRLIAGGGAKAGPVLSGLDPEQTGDGCHPDSEGQRVWGEDVLRFFGVDGRTPGRKAAAE